MNDPVTTFSESPSTAANHVDVLIIGAGISGVSAAYYLQKDCPQKSYAILERRQSTGGTWDLFRYPGIRSDSDMYTLGFAFKPWEEQKAIADGPSIWNYVKETAAENGIDKKINFGRHVKNARWSSADAQWTVDAVCEESGETERWTCNFLSFCSGYYNYDAGYTPEFPGRENYTGDFIHPQHWLEDLDYEGKRVVVIGSGATAVTLVPAMAEKAAHVTMLQRTPTYMVSRPSQDWFANLMRKILPSRAAYGVTRWRNVLVQLYFFTMARKFPGRVKKRLLGWLREELPSDYDIEQHFTPSYNPWDQRLCLVPDSDMFLAIKKGSASIVTDQIETFTERGIQLKSGETLDADIVVSATGLALQMLGGVDVYVDGERLNTGERMTYRGMMCSGAPNLSFTFGYTNASWTLKADLTSQYLCRLLNHMDATGAVECRPVLDDPTVGKAPFVDFSSGYFKRAESQLPKQGTKKPWKLNQNYALDIVALRYGDVDDGVMRFRTAGEPPLVSVTARASLQAAE